MECRVCGTTIAANALICYRCGSATAAPRVPPPARRRGRGVRWWLPGLLAAAVLGGAAAWFLR